MGYNCKRYQIVNCAETTNLDVLHTIRLLRHPFSHTFTCTPYNSPAPKPVFTHFQLYSIQDRE